MSKHAIKSVEGVFCLRVCYRFALALLQYEQVDDMQICPQHCFNNSTEHSSLHWKNINVSTDSNVAIARALYRFTAQKSFSSRRHGFSSVLIYLDMHPHCSKFKLQFRYLLLVDPWLSFDPKCYAHVYVTVHYRVKKFKHFAELLQRLASREALGYFPGTLAVRVS